LTPGLLALTVYPGAVFVALALWGGSCLRNLVLTKAYGWGTASLLEPIRYLKCSFGRRWAVYSGIPNVAVVWLALMGLMAGLVAMALMPFPGSPLFAIGAVATAQYRPWNLVLLWLLIEMVPLSQTAVIRALPDARAQLAASRRLALFKSYILPQSLVVAALALAAGTTDMLEIARSGGAGLTLLKLGLGIISAGLIMARNRIGPFDADANLLAGEPEGLLPGQLLGLLRLSRALGWLASTSFVVFAFMPLPPSGWAALGAWALYSAALTAALTLTEVEQPAWHPDRWWRVLWILGTPVGIASLLVALAMRGS
jgi:hypothetical protein